MSDITPYDIAHVIGVLLDRTQTNEGGVIGADVLDEVLRIDLTLRDGDKVHFRAVVVEGEQTPIVLPAGAGAYIGGEDYLYLRCDRCDGILRLIESGVSLEEQNEALAEHECPDEAAQTQTGGAQ